MRVTFVKITLVDGRELTASFDLRWLPFWLAVGGLLVWICK